MFLTIPVNRRLFDGNNFAISTALAKVCALLSAILVFKMFREISFPTPLFVGIETAGIRRRSNQQVSLGPPPKGTTEKARTENSAPSKMQGWKTRERKTRHQIAGVEMARTENAAPMCNGGKGENRKRGTKVQGWKRRENVYIVLIFS